MQILVLAHRLPVWALFMVFALGQLSARKTRAQSSTEAG